MPKFLGIDYGAKRVGLAVSDDRGVIAFPKAVLSNDHTLLSALTELIRTEVVRTVVFGESRNNQGEENPIMKDVRAFAQKLAAVAPVTIQFEPEFYTSVEARRDNNKTAVDAEAATLLLNSYIARTHPS